jgi:N6-adenosine-specific RNA methylase IME4
MTMTIDSGPFQGLQKNGYRVILADPAWTYATRSNKGKGRSPENHYDCMTLDEIKALPVSDLAMKNTVLLLWTIDTHLPMALEVITAWGFTFKTVGFYWAKTNRDGSPFTGMGFWTRANPEQCLLAVGQDEGTQCLLATIGRPKREAKDVKRLVMAPRREHSRKPDDIHHRIENLVAGPYVELFARQTRPGWHTWGNQATKFDPGLPHLELDLLGEPVPEKSTISTESIEELLG